MEWLYYTFVFIGKWVVRPLFIIGLPVYLVSIIVKIDSFGDFISWVVLTFITICASRAMWNYIRDNY